MRKFILVIYFGNIWKNEHFSCTEDQLEEEGQMIYLLATDKSQCLGLVQCLLNSSS